MSRAETVAAFQERLRQAFEASGLRQQDVAEKLGVNRARVSDWLRGAHLPAAEYLLALPEVLGVDGGWLLAGEAGGFERGVEHAAGEMERALRRLREVPAAGGPGERKGQ